MVQDHIALCRVALILPRVWDRVALNSSRSGHYTSVSTSPLAAYSLSDISPTGNRLNKTISSLKISSKFFFLRCWGSPVPWLIQTTLKLSCANLDFSTAPLSPSPRGSWRSLLLCSERWLASCGRTQLRHSSWRPWSSRSTSVPSGGRMSFTGACNQTSERRSCYSLCPFFCTQKL